MKKTKFDVRFYSLSYRKTDVDVQANLNGKNFDLVLVSMMSLEYLFSMSTISLFTSNAEILKTAFLLHGRGLMVSEILNTINKFMIHK